MLAPQHPEVMKNVQTLIPERLCTSAELKWLNDELLEEVNNDYEFSLRKAIGKNDLLIYYVSLYSTIDERMFEWTVFLVTFLTLKISVDYILKDSKEKERLHIEWTPLPFPQRYKCTQNLKINFKNPVAFMIGFELRCWIPVIQIVWIFGFGL